MSEVELHAGTDLAQQMDYAKAAASASILPSAYRGNPANVLIAIGLGRSMGLSPAESLYRINVIQGTPSASAELIASNVRKAGHKLRLEVDDVNEKATCTIIRHDDPDFPHVVTRDKEWAKRMKLLDKDNYQKQPATMLGWRAVSACARQACSEALFGVAYTPDEAAEARPVKATAKLSAADFAGATAAPVEAEIVDEATGEIVEKSGHDEFAPERTSNPDPPAGITRKQSSDLGKLMKQHAIDRDTMLGMAANVAGRDIQNSTELTEAEAADLIDALTPAEETEPEQAELDG